MMKRLFFILTILITTVIVRGQELYIKTFGNPDASPIIFLHGGPGYNSAGFEATTGNALSNNGYFVIVYDRRGEGRSKDVTPNAAFTFQQTFDDLIDIYKKFDLNKASLIGHSFGGIVASLFAEKYPDKVNKLILVSAPVSLQQTFKTILQSSEQIYKTKKDSTNLKYIAMLKKMDTASIEYASYCFAHAISNGFYTPKNMTEEAKAIYSHLRKDSLAKYTSQMTYEAPQGFWKQEHYTTIDLTSNIKDLLLKKIKVYGLYGKDDGLYSAKQVLSLQRMLGTKNVKYLNNCSHNVFIDQQQAFIRSLKEWLK